MVASGRCFSLFEATRQLDSPLRPPSMCSRFASAPFIIALPALPSRPVAAKSPSCPFTPLLAPSSPTPQHLPDMSRTSPMLAKKGASQSQGAGFWV